MNFKKCSNCKIVETCWLVKRDLRDVCGNYRDQVKPVNTLKKEESTHIEFESDLDVNSLETNIL